MLARLFLRHPHAVGESYAEHQASALAIACSLLGATLACFVHAIIPGLFQTTASRIIGNLHASLIQRAAKPPAVRGSTAAELFEYQI